MELSRRAFMGVGAAAALSVGAIKFIGDGATEALAAGNRAVGNNVPLDNMDEGYEPLGIDLPWCGPGSEEGDWTATPDDIKAVGGCTMPVDELVRRRHMYVDSQTEYVCEDGTVIPEVYVKCHALLNTYGFGTGNAIADDSFDFLMQEMTEEQAQALLDMPWDGPFTAWQFEAESDYTLDQCTEFCEALSVEKGMINRYTNDSGTYYCVIPPVQGIIEYHDPDLYQGRISTAGFTGEDWSLAFAYGGAPFFGSSPCCREVVKDDAIYDLDDVRAVWAEKNKFSLSPCTCRMDYAAELPDYPDGDWDLSDVTSDACGHDILTCLSCGEEAQFWIDHGVGKEITYEEALARLDLSMEQGFIFQRTTSKNAETICSCSGDCCGILAMWLAAGADTPGFKNASHYVIEFNEDTCIQCGTCANRCPMKVITMDEETGYPVVGDLCMACGQCAYVCPTSSRWLVPKPEDEFYGWYDDILTQNNIIAAQRFEEGYVW